MRWVLSLLFLGLDIFSKIGALRMVPPMYWSGYPFGGIPIFEDFLGISFSLNLVFNTGAAWGFFQGNPGLLFLVRIGIILGFGAYVLLRRKDLAQTLSFALVAAGALGNTIDYLAYGSVVDFFHVVLWGYSFPIFNVADVCISLGAIGFVLQGRTCASSSLSAPR